MSDLGWRADGIDSARAAGGVELELYRRPGFLAGKAVRRSEVNYGGSGVPADLDYAQSDPGPYDAIRTGRNVTS